MSYLWIYITENDETLQLGMEKIPDLETCNIPGNSHWEFSNGLFLGIPLEFPVQEYFPKALGAKEEWGSNLLVEDTLVWIRRLDFTSA